MGEIETVKNRIRKLLALSKSNNENEAALALKKANELIKNYNLDEKTIRFESVRVKATKTYVPWRTLIINAVSWLYGCDNYRSPSSGTVVFAGDSLYVFIASEMYIYLIKTIERAVKKSIRKNAKYKFRRDFKYGMADRLYDRIYELGQNCSWAPYRESSIEGAKEFVKSLVELTCTTKTSKVKLNQAALLKGRLHGNAVSLARQAGWSEILRLTE